MNPGIILSHRKNTSAMPHHSCNILNLLVAISLATCPTAWTFTPRWTHFHCQPELLERTRIKRCHNLIHVRSPSPSQLNAIDSLSAAAAASAPVLSDYTPAATSLFNNMKLPAAVVTAGMISLGFATSFPELPPDSPERQYSPRLRRRCESLRRLHIVTALVSVTSELIVVMWAAVEVNQLTERVYAPTATVWDLVQRDCDLAWSAVNSHFVLGIIGFVTMLALRAYVMLLAAEASSALMTAASTGTAAALCLMISIVNRGVEAGGGEGVGYGKTILDLVRHYGILLARCATDAQSPGPLEFSAIILEVTSLAFALQVLLLANDKMEDEEECPVVDLDSDYAPLTSKEQEKLDICLAMEARQHELTDSSKKEKAKELDSDSSVNIL
mmetsp:Transcript_24925/g.55230  ORF Transcript_24925/g.55230 Transcript_24925/m.55230 type:complete len:386 (-) Transcript_24925:2346-3503(-)